MMKELRSEPALERSSAGKVQPTVLVIILHYGRHEDTFECLESLDQIAYSNFAVAVVDNGGGPSISDALARRHPKVIYLPSSDSAGFAAGNNVGLRFGLSEGYTYSLILNNDTTVDPKFLEHLVAAMEEDERITLAGPSVYFFQSEKLWACGGRIQYFAATMAGIYSLSGFRSPVKDVDYLPGVCILIRNSSLQEIGLMPERYFLAFEEGEFAVRARRAGYRVVACRCAKIWHKVGMSSDRKPRYIYNCLRNRFIFGEFLAGPRFARVFRFYLLARILLRFKRLKIGLMAFRDHQKYGLVRREHLDAFDLEYGSVERN